jgi:hypothetical protein
MNSSSAIILHMRMNISVEKDADSTPQSWQFYQHTICCMLTNKNKSAIRRCGKELFYAREYIISPRLHHRTPLIQKVSAMVGCLNFVLHCMGQRSFC